MSHICFHPDLWTASASAILVSMATTKTYQAYCTTCGWEGRSLDHQSDAEQDGSEHEVAIADPRNIHDHHYTDVRQGQQNQATPTYVVIGNHFWGLGSTIDEAKKNLKKEGGSLSRYVVYLLPPGAVNVRVHSVRGDILWDWEDGADTSLHVEIVAKHGVK
jgi:hypothetical protein